MKYKPTCCPECKGQLRLVRWERKPDDLKRLAIFKCENPKCKNDEEYKK